MSDPGEDLAAILAVSRSNNGMDGISGVLWFDGHRFVQVLEGPAESVAGTFDRILRDDRHTNIVVLIDEPAVDRKFADWAMASLHGERGSDVTARLEMMLRNAGPDIQRCFSAPDVQVRHFSASPV
jgi:hypothetical protein